MVEVGGYRLEINRPATSESYGRGIAGPESCSCVYCRNWVAGRGRLLPAEVRALLKEMGVPDDGEIEVWQVPGDDHPHGYGGWYMAVGRIVSAPPEASHEFMLGGWRLWFSSRASYAVQAFANQPTVELHFFTWADNYIDDAALHVV